MCAKCKKLEKKTLIGWLDGRKDNKMIEIFCFINFRKMAKSTRVKLKKFRKIVDNYKKIYEFLFKTRHFSPIFLQFSIVFSRFLASSNCSFGRFFHWSKGKNTRKWKGKEHRNAQKTGKNHTHTQDTMWEI